MAKKPKYRDEDLFKDSTMSFGEHLEELRICLFKAIAGMVVALVLVLVFDWANWTVRFLQEPLRTALERYYLKQAEKRTDSEIKRMADEGIPVTSSGDLNELITNDRMMPEFVRLDVRQTLKTLSEVHGFHMPEDAEKFAPTEFVNAKEFCEQVYNNRETADSLPKYLWDGFSADGQKLITAITKAPKPPERKEIGELARELSDRILTQPNFYAKNEAFFDAIAKDQPSWLAMWLDLTGSVAQRKKRADTVLDLETQLKEAKTSSDPTARYREINRKLLAIAYPRAVAANPRYANMLAITLWRQVADDPRVGIKSLNSQEMFLIWMKAALLLSLIIASPWVFYQIWSFVAAGLYPHEKNFVMTFLPFSIVLFLSGAALCFFLVFQYVLEFLLRFNEWMNTEPDMRISEWFGFALFLPLGFGVAFQLPLVMLFLQRIGVMTVSGYLSKWRISVLIIAFASAILTPSPDPYSMMLMCGPLVALYFGGILLCKYVPSRRSMFDEDEAETASA